MTMISAANTSGYSSKYCEDIDGKCDTVHARILHPIIASRFEDQAFATDDVPTTYDNTKFQPIVNAQNSPIVT